MGDGDQRPGPADLGVGPGDVDEVGGRLAAGLSRAHELAHECRQLSRALEHEGGGRGGDAPDPDHPSAQAAVHMVTAARLANVLVGVLADADRARRAPRSSRTPRNLDSAL